MATVFAQPTVFDASKHGVAVTTTAVDKVDDPIKNATGLIDFYKHHASTVEALLSLYRGSQGELAKTKKQLDETRQELDNTKTKLGKTEKDLDETRKELGETEESLRKTKIALAAESAALVVALARIAVLEGKLKKTEEELTKEKKDHAATKADLEGKLGKKEQELADEKKAHAATKEALEAKLKTKEGELAAEKKAHAATKGALKQTKDDLDKEVNAHNVTKADLLTAKGKVRDANDALRKAEGKVTRAEEDLKAAEDHNKNLVKLIDRFSVGDSITAGVKSDTTLHPWQLLTSDSGRFRAVQVKGALRIFNEKMEEVYTPKNMKTSDETVKNIRMQYDGQLCIYKENGVDAIWASQTWQLEGYTNSLCMDDDGHLKIFASKNGKKEVKWSSVNDK